MTDEEETEKLRRYRRAKELLVGTDWLFDMFIEKKLREILRTGQHDAESREALWRQATVAGELRDLLTGEISAYEGEQILKERRKARP
jgi:hypothetical protein